MVETRTISLKSSGQLDVINITDQVTREIASSGIVNGIVTIFCGGSTGAVSTVEYEPGLKRDIKEVFGEMIPYGRDYHHHQTWGDDNGSGHLLSTLLKTSLTVPIVNRKMTLGTWQQIVFIECDTRSRHRNLILQIIGE